MAIWNPFRKKDKPESTPTQKVDEVKTVPVEPVVPEQPVKPVEPVVAEQPRVPEIPDEPRTPEVAVEPVAREIAAQSEEKPVAKTTEAKVGIFGRFRQALKKTVQVLNTDIRDLVGKEGRLVDDDFLDELFTYLVKTDMGNRPASKIRDEIKQKFRGRKVHMADLVESAKTTIREIMSQDNAGLAHSTSGPTVIMVVGVNGSGKTTSIAKLTHRFVNEGKKVVLGAGDTFRAAAVEQLTIWAERLGAEIVTGRQGSDPASVAYKAADAAKKSEADICIVDTAGRLQTQVNLMDELTRIKNVIGKVLPDAPHEVLLVLDATAGQNAISQAKGFSAAAGCTGIILAKLDGTAKGGVAIPIRQEFGLPVKFIGLGETPDAFAEFSVDNYVDALFAGTEDESDS
ncbi:MAG: signal recognition particle-docking protein FtsY [Pirellulaceae bacterium]